MYINHKHILLYNYSTVYAYFIGINMHISILSFIYFNKYISFIFVVDIVIPSDLLREALSGVIGLLSVTR